MKPTYRRLTLQRLHSILTDSRTTAVAGIPANPERPSHSVAAYLQQHGYRIIPVNPNITEVLGEKAYASVRNIPGPVDVVDIFRRSDAVTPIVEAAIAKGAKVAWIQVGVIDNYASLVISRTVLDANTAGQDGGAIDNYSSLVISRSVLEANTAGTHGGGIIIYQTFVPSTMVIDQSTLSHNGAMYGGGIYYNDVVAARSHLTLINSTLSGNAAHDGGGIYAIGDAHIDLFNATIAGNQVFRPVPRRYPARGGGLFITSTAQLTAQNTLLGNNVFNNGLDLPTPDDCFTAATTSLRSAGYNLIQTLNNCSVLPVGVGDVTFQDPLLGPLQNNGGPTPTRALLPGSPAIDAGNPAGCSDDTGAPITTDQRGFMRSINGRCDIGAFEYSPFGLFLPLIRR